MAREILIFDGDCGFCTQSAIWLKTKGSELEIKAWQTFPNLLALGLNEQKLETAAYFVRDDIVAFRGSDAIAAALRKSHGFWKFVGIFLGAPIVRIIAQQVYKLVARNRHRMPGSNDSCKL